MKKLVKTSAGLTILASLLLGGATAFGSSAPTHPAAGRINVFYAAQGLSGKAAVTITGAIGDYGTAVSVDKDGTPDPNGNYSKLTLKQGTFQLNATALDAKFASTKPTTYLTTCSGQETGTSPVKVLAGTGAYKGITGTVKATFTGAFIIPRDKTGSHAGQCNTKAPAPLGAFTVVTGSGEISFG
jgi:hypothetical protein